jgi:hypothetical protein
MEQQGKQPTAASQMDAKEKLKLAAIAMAANGALHATQNEGKNVSSERIDPELVNKVLAHWPQAAKAAARKIMDYYGPPNEITPSRLFWYQNGPWKRTIAYREEAPHDFPVPHTDVLEQTIAYHVPAEKVGDIGLFDGSLIIARTKGEVTANCDNEGANILALNLMHDIVTGIRSPQEARNFAKEEIAAFLMDRPAPYAENFQFDLPAGVQWDPDHVAAVSDVLTQAVKKAADGLGFDGKEE